MQHKLLYSKLRPSVKGSSLHEVIGGSFSGENPHRAAAMELIFERTIQERREGVAAGAAEPNTQPSPANPPATDKKPEKAKSKPVKPEKKQAQPPPSKPPAGPKSALASLQELFLYEKSQNTTAHSTQSATSLLKEKRK